MAVRLCGSDSVQPTYTIYNVGYTLCIIGYIKGFVNYLATGSTHQILAINSLVLVQLYLRWDFIDVSQAGLKLDTQPKMTLRP